MWDESLVQKNMLVMQMVNVLNKDYPVLPAYDILELKPCFYTYSNVPGSPLTAYGLLMDDVIALELKELMTTDSEGTPLALREGAVAAALIPILRQYRDEMRSVKLRTLELERRLNVPAGGQPEVTQSNRPASP